VLKEPRAKGLRGFRAKLYRYAKDAVFKARQYEYRDRKKRKGSFRRFWIQRISAGVCAEGITYSRFIEGTKAANIQVDRMVLADLVVNDPPAFKAIDGQVKEDLAAKLAPPINRNQAEVRLGFFDLNFTNFKVKPKKLQSKSMSF